MAVRRPQQVGRVEDPWAGLPFSDPESGQNETSPNGGESGQFEILPQEGKAESYEESASFDDEGNVLFPDDITGQLGVDVIDGITAEINRQEKTVADEQSTEAGPLVIDVLSEIRDGIAELTKRDAGITAEQLKLRGDLEKASERFWRDPGYFQELYGLDQEYIVEELDTAGEIVVDNAAGFSLDIAGFSALSNQFLKESKGIGGGDNYKSSQAALSVTERLFPIQREMVEIIRSQGGEVDQFLGDGINAMFRGGTSAENVRRAVRVAAMVQLEMAKYEGINARIGISIGEVRLRGYGAKGEKRADMTGPAILEAERVQAKADSTRGGERLCHAITLSDKAAETFSKDERLLSESGIYVLNKGLKEMVSLASPVEWQREIVAPENLDVLSRAIRVREDFLSPTRVREIRKRYTDGTEPKPRPYSVSTMFVRLNNVEDFESTNKQMTAIFDIATRHQGKIDKVHNGVVMINFIAGLNDINSVEAGVQVVDELNAANISFAASIGRSEALIVNVNDRPTVYGEGVIRARRLLDVDNPGGVLIVDDETRMRMLSRKVESEMMEKIFVKGFDEPVGRHLITRIERAYELPVGKELVGRERELTVLENDFQECRQGGKARVIVAEQGVGKSALAAEFLSRKRNERVHVMVGRAEQYNRRESYSVWRNLFENALGLQDMTPEEQKRVVEEFYTSNLPDWKGDLELLNSIVGPLFEESEKFRYLDAGEKNELRADMIVATIHALSSFDTPAVVLLEDMHYFDSDSLDLAKRVTGKIHHSDAYLLMTTWPYSENEVDVVEDGKIKTVMVRTEMPPRGLMTQEGILQMGGLPVMEGEYDQIKGTPEFARYWSENGELIFKALNAFVELDEADFKARPDDYKLILTKLVQKTDGNLMYLGSAIRHLVIYKGTSRYFEEKSTKLLPSGEPVAVWALGNVRIDDMSELDAVPTIDAIELERFELLDIEAQNVLKDAAVDGMQFSSLSPARISKMPQERVESLLRYAEQKGFVRPLTRGQWMFLHGTTQRAIYNSMAVSSPENARELANKHSVLGEFHEQESPDDYSLLIRHYKHSTQPLKALKLIDKYISQLSKDSLYASIIDQVTSAGHLVKEIRDNGWTIPNTNLEKTDRVQLTDEEIDDLVDVHIARVSRGVGVWREVGLIEKANPLVEQALTLFTETHSTFDEMKTDDKLIYINLHRDKAANQVSQNRVKEAQATLELARQQLDQAVQEIAQSNGQAEELLQRADKIRSRIEVIQGRAMVVANGDYIGALQHYKTAGSYANDYDERVTALNGQAGALMHLGRLKEAKAVYDQIIKEANQAMDKSDLVVFVNNRAGLLARAGRISESRAEYLTNLQLAKSLSKVGSVKWIEASLGYLERSDGNYVEALKYFQQAVDYFQEQKRVVALGGVREEMTFCLTRLRRIEEAKEMLLLVIEGLKHNNRAMGRYSTLMALLQMVESQHNSETTEKIFQEGIARLIKKHGDDAAFDLLYFGEEEIKIGELTNSLNYITDGLVKVQQAKNLYQQVGDFSEMKRIDALLHRFGTLEQVV